jgi:hypothetical protein
MKRVAIIQSCYVPWIGFFDLISRCDEYIVFDQVQFAKRHWHNRNRIKTPKGAEWLTIPVLTKSRMEQPIDEVEISEPWAERHWRSLEYNYKKSAHFSAEQDVVRSWFEAVDKLRLLTEINTFLLRQLADWFGLSVRIVPDREYAAEGRQTERLLSLCKSAAATCYISGPSAKAYLDESIFLREGIEVEWMSYGPYPEYPQLYGDFDIAVSVLDQIFNLGAEARKHLPAARPQPVLGASR